jgi:hypothetical protein
MNDRPVALVLGGIVIGMVTLGLVWIVGSNGSGSTATDRAGQIQQAPQTPQTPQSQQTQGAGTSPTDAHTAQPLATGGPLERCADAAAALAHPLRRAAASVDQWEIHVGAMNKLVVGAITLPQATAFWNRTRVGARDKIDAFDQAAASLQRRGVDCPAPDLLPERSARDLRACAAQVAADVRVLHAAQTAIDTWQRHVKAMNMLRAGMMSPATATRMWLAMWHRGQGEINSYRAAVRAAHGLGGCPAALSQGASTSP